jgi:hypothetical protein
MGNNLDAAIMTELRRSGATPGTATLDQVWSAHRNVYHRLGREDWARAVHRAYFEGKGITY